MVQNKLYEAGRFVLVAPAANSPVHQAATAYRQHLRDEGCVSFEALSLEAVIAAIGSSGGTRIAQRLFDRYANFSELDRFI